MSPEAVNRLTDLLLDENEARGFAHRNASGAGERLVANLKRHLQLADPDLYEHSVRVAQWARRTAARLPFAAAARRVLNIAALFHDIGKVPFLNLVHKPGPLTREERALLAVHPELGAWMLYHIGPPFRRAAPLVRAHHQRYDADGAPTLLGARVIAVADVYDAIVSPRPYHLAVTAEMALREIRCEAGAKFDPRVVAAFLEVHDLESAGAQNPLRRGLRGRRGSD